MKLAYFPNQTALQSEPIWRAFLSGIKKLGYTPIEGSMDADAALIWSMLWSGRMRNNRLVYDHYRSQNKPVFIIEVGVLDRGRTWKVCLNDITSRGTYANTDNFIQDRTLNISLQERNKTSEAVLIVGQHDLSHQWPENITLEKWLRNTVNNLKQHTDRQIVFRSHPRCVRHIDIPEITIEHPMKLENSYDKFNIDFGYHAVVGFNSGPTIQSVIHNTPVICDMTSLAYPMSTLIENIENGSVPDRSLWFQQILHTEWTREEIEKGIPQTRLLNS